jgi:hypothetical protein
MLSTTMRRAAATSLLVSLTVGVWSSGPASAGTCPAPLPQGNEPVTLDPADFTGPIDNPYWPITPGATWIYRETDPSGGTQKVRVHVTDRTREILGIRAVVVHDVVRERGDLVENTWDWYAQDACGNVWYLGEDTREYEDGVVVSTAGSWEAGVDGAQPGVVVPADPRVGMTYRQESLPGEAEDRAAVLSVDEQAEVPAGHFDDVVLTKEFTPVSPDVLEYKLYAPGVGVVLAIGVSGGSDTERLIRYETAEG